MTNKNFETPAVVVAAYRTYLLTAKSLLKMKKPYRYTLGVRIENNLLAILEDIFNANILPSPLREQPLIKGHVRCELLKLLTRACFEMELIEPTHYFQISGELTAISKMLYAWIKYVRSGPQAKTK